ncbi:MAG TPA: TetR/AcrR family transcriptional regulator [Caulobacteraceae bacterium]|jgi:AcrR family transcriptional regulator|nr:TetR/AcrR family transcriptional regulator [Caulobacteraceae bacterium]
MRRTAPARRATDASAPRRPSQQRSRLRFEMLLDAADALLADRETTDVGLYDIAGAAKVPPASAYHLFPTKEAAFVALAQRYLIGLSNHIIRPVTPAELRRWQDFIALEMRRGVEYYNDHKVMAKLFFGANVIPDIRLLDVRNVAAASATTYGRMDRLFAMPYLHDADTKFATLIGIYDGIWMTSYARHGHITADFARESELAGIAYCETFLPAVIPLRPPTVA